MPTSEPSGCLPAIFRIFGLAGGGAPTAAKGSQPLPYKRKDYLLSKAERSFFGVLQQAVGGQYLIFVEICMADLLYMSKGTTERTSHRNKIDRKHIDFVLCDHANIRPLLAIELDDSSHQREDRKVRDTFVDDAFRAAGLPFLRVPCKAGYSVNDLQNEIRAKITSSA